MSISGKRLAAPSVKMCGSPALARVQCTVDVVYSRRSDSSFNRECPGALTSRNSAIAAGGNVEDMAREFAFLHLSLAVSQDEV